MDKMGDNSNVPHPKCIGSQKTPGMEQKTCGKGPNLGFEYLPAYKTLHCVHTACTAFPMNLCMHLCMHVCMHQSINSNHAQTVRFGVALFLQSCNNHDVWALWEPLAQWFTYMYV